MRRLANGAAWACLCVCGVLCVVVRCPRQSENFCDRRGRSECDEGRLGGGRGSHGSVAAHRVCRWWWSWIWRAQALPRDVQAVGGRVRKLIDSVTSTELGKKRRVSCDVQ